MKIIKMLSFRYLKKNIKKCIVILLGIILSTTMLFSVALGASTIRGNSIKREILYGGDHHALFKNVNYDNYLKLVNNNKIIDIVSIQDAFLISSSQLDNNVNSEEFILTVKSMDRALDEYIILEDGSFPDNNKEIIISNDFQYMTGYNIDDLVFGHRIVGIYKDNKLDIEEYEINYINNTSKFNPVAFTKDSIKQNINGNYMVTFKNSLNMYGNIYSVADNLGFTYGFDEFGNRDYNNVLENVGLLQAMGQVPNIKYMMGTYGIIIVILLVISMFSIMTIKNSFSISLSERKKYFGTLRSIGASKKQIFKMILLETLVLSIISIPIGIILSYGFTNFILGVINNIAKDIIIDNYKIVAYPLYLVISFIFIILTILLSSIKPARNASEISLIECIKENKMYSVLKSKENYPLIKKIFGYEGELAYKTIKRNNSKFSVTVNSLIISIILFITLSTFTNFLLANTVYNGGYDYDIGIQVYNSKEQQEIVDRIKKIDGIDEITIKKSGSLRYKNKDNMLTNKTLEKNQLRKYSYIDIIGLDLDNYNGLLKKLNIKDDKVLIYNIVYEYNEVLDNHNGYNWFNNDVDDINICSVKEDYINNILIEENCYYTFDNLYFINEKNFNEFNHTPMIILPIDKYDDFLNNYYAKNIGEVFDYLRMYDIKINSDKYKLVDIEMKKIFEDYSALNLESSYRNYILDNYEDYVRVNITRFVINVSMIFIVIISITSIINTMSTNLALREMDFAILKSVGVSRKGLNKMLCLESLFLGFKAILLGIPSATFFVLIEVYFGRFILKTNFAIPYDSYMISIISVFIIVFIMNVYGINKIKNKNIIDSIRRNSI